MLENSSKGVVKRVEFQNENWQNDYTYDIELSRFFLRISGLWPTITRRSKRYSRLTTVLSAFLLIFFFVPQGCWIFFIEQDSNAKILMIGPFIFTGMAIAKHFIVLIRHEGVVSCIEAIADDWRHADETFCRPIMLRYASTSRFVTKLYAFFVFGGVGFYSWILPFVNNRHGANVTSRPFAYPSEYYVFDTQKSPIYEIVFLGHSISMLGVVCTVTCGICSLTVEFVMHACSQYEIVVAFIRSIDEYYSGDNEHQYLTDSDKTRLFVEKKVGQVIKRHLHAVAFASRIEKVLNETCLVDLMGHTFNICLLGYDMLVGWADTDPLSVITYIVLMSAFITNVFLFCFIGERLTEKSRQVGVAGYMTNWWGMPEAQARAFILVIATADIPVKFTAGKMVNLSLQTFASVIKASVAYLNALRAVI